MQLKNVLVVEENNQKFKFQKIKFFKIKKKINNNLKINKKHKNKKLITHEIKINYINNDQTIERKEN